MSSDSESSASSEHEKSRHHKTSKKERNKSEKKSKKQKKEKRHKQKKRSRPDSSADDTAIKEQTLAPTSCISNEPNNAIIDTFGPALPPHLIKKSVYNIVKPVIGPIMPSHLKKDDNQPEKNSNLDNDEEDLTGCFGPIPDGSLVSKTAQQIELEQRALELKIAAIEGTTTSNVDQKVREEWMLELPDVGLKGGLAALANMKRTFHQGKEKPDFSDRSSWTKTPQTESNDKEKPNTSRNIANEAIEKYAKERDDEQERIAKRHKKKHKREESLVQMHQKKLRKEQRKKEKELAASGSKPERRPFTRDVDLKLNKIDKNQTKQIVDKAKILNTKFSTGNTKYL